MAQAPGEGRLVWNRPLGRLIPVVRAPQLSPGHELQAPAHPPQCCAAMPPFSPSLQGGGDSRQAGQKCLPVVPWAVHLHYLGKHLSFSQDPPCTYREDQAPPCPRKEGRADCWKPEPPCIPPGHGNPNPSPSQSAPMRTGGEQPKEAWGRWEDPE